MWNEYLLATVWLLRQAYKSLLSEYHLDVMGVFFVLMFLHAVSYIVRRARA